MTLETDQQIGEITTILDSHPEGLSRGHISEKLSFSINDKTLQRRLAALVSDGRITKTGVKKATLYHPVLGTIKRQKSDDLVSVFSPSSQKTLGFHEMPLYFTGF